MTMHHLRLTLLAFCLPAFLLSAGCLDENSEPGTYQLLFAAAGEPEGSIHRILTNGKSDTGMGSGGDLFVAEGGEWATHTLIFSGESTDVRVMETNGKSSFLLELTTDVTERLPTLTSDGSKVAWIADDSGAGTTGVYVADAAEGAVGTLLMTVEAPFFVAHRPVFSADGQSLALLLSFSESGVDYTRLELIPTDGGTPETLTQTNQVLTDPHFSADGTRLHFVNVGEGLLEFIRLSDMGVESLVEEISAYSHLAFSADDSRVVYSAQGDDGEEHVYAMNADGSNKVQLSERKGMQIDTLDISFDGRFVMWFAQDPSDPTAAENKVLFARDSEAAVKEGLYTVVNGTDVLELGFAQ
jgi:Tol biopolymer transport system component